MVRRVTQRGRAIAEMKTPSNVEELRRYLGLVNYLSKFLNNPSTTLKPLQNLLCKDVAWNWSSVQQKAFEAIRDQIINAPVLAFYDPEKPLVLENDASDYRLGSAMYQEGMPIAYASRSLTQSERNYAQIEKEMLAVVFGLEKFHHFTYGRKVEVITDHKPLVSISLKPLSCAPKRLQNMLLRAQRYDIRLQHHAGTSIPVADTLSRAPLPDDTPAHVEVVHNLSMTPVKDALLAQIKTETQSDKSLCMLMSTIMKGWPDRRDDVPSEARLYFNYRDELTCQDGILLRGNRIIIPLSLRAEMKQRIHTGHLGINACLRRARDILYWPGISTKVREYVESCTICAESSDKQSAEPLIMQEVPDVPWIKVAMDIFTIKGRNYLLTVDFMSSFFEVDLLLDMQSETVINKVKQHFARHGIPSTVVTDGGTQFTSQQFKDFGSRYGFTHNISSPGNSQANGCAEAHVKVAKRIMKRCAKAKEDPYLGLLNWRNTPTEGLSTSPAQRLFGRQTKTILPTTKNVLQYEHSAEQKAAKEGRKQQVADRYIHRRELKPLGVGAKVRVQPTQPGKHEWEEGLVMEILPKRNYCVKTNTGKKLRNRRLLRPVKSNTATADLPVMRASSPRISPTLSTPEKPATSRAPMTSGTPMAPTTPAAPVTPATPGTQGKCATPVKVSKIPKPTSPVTQGITRSGRVIKPVVKLNI